MRDFHFFSHQKKIICKYTHFEPAIYSLVFSSSFRLLLMVNCKDFRYLLVLYGFIWFYIVLDVLHVQFSSVHYISFGKEGATGDLLLRVEACNFIKKETLAQVFSCKFCEIFKNTIFYGTTPGDCFCRYNFVFPYCDRVHGCGMYNQPCIAGITNIHPWSYF